ncbi:acetylserotonin O-methyltransferase-like [Ascaphus truei]|uniref:acetylserotonin O-methyltransferase-like n=1 Tax=Ascaphus truei TaxID=8439 RepID=UPI003F5A92CE
MNSSEDLDYPKQILEYMDGFFISKTMFAACELGVFDVLHESDLALSAAAVAARLGTSVDGTDRLLSACVGLKLLKADMKNEEGKTCFLVNYTVYSHALQDSFTGEVSHQELIDFIDYCRSEDQMKAFMDFMDSMWNICGKDVIAAFDLSVFSTVYDLGGCSGCLAKQFVSVYPESTVTILDMPKVVQMAKKHFITDEEHRISFHEGDFFNDPIPEADLFIMARIIHDWTEEKCSQLLNKIYKSCKPGGGLLLVEVLLNEDKSGPLTSQLLSLNMLVHAEGKERTPSEYSKLLTASGFKDIQVKATGKIYDAILGRK